MPEHRPSATTGLIRLADAVGVSPDSWEAAVADAVRSIRREVPRPIGVEISRQWADLEAGRIIAYRVSVRVAYRQEARSPRRTTA